MHTFFLRPGRIIGTGWVKNFPRGPIERFKHEVIITDLSDINESYLKIL